MTCAQRAVVLGIYIGDIGDTAIHHITAAIDALHSFPSLSPHFDMARSKAKAFDARRFVDDEASSDDEEDDEGQNGSGEDGEDEDEDEMQNGHEPSFLDDDDDEGDAGVTPRPNLSE